MFDFFEEVIEYLSQVVTNQNWFSSTIDSFLSSAEGTLRFLSSFSQSVPALLSWVLLASGVVLVFDFIRGR